LGSGSEEERDEEEALLSLFLPARELIGLASLAGEALAAGLAGGSEVLVILEMGSYSAFTASVFSVVLPSASLDLL